MNSLDPESQGWNENRTCTYTCIGESETSLA